MTPFLYLSCFLIALASGMGSGMDNKTHARIIEQLLDNIRKCESVTFTAVNTENLEYPDGRRVEIRTVLRYWGKGDKFRAEVIDGTKGDAATPTFVTAYDGEKHQSLRHDLPSLGYSKESHLVNPSITVNPLLLAFGWLHNPRSPVTWGEIRRRETWETAFARAVQRGRAVRENVECEIVDFPGLIPNTINRVYFARKFRFFPMAVESIDQRSNEVFYNQHVSLYCVEEERVWIPAVIQTSFDAAKLSHKVGGAVKSECVYRITPESVAVNIPLDDSLFILRAPPGGIVTDIDKVKKLANSDRVGKTSGRHFESSWTFLIGNVFLLGLVCVLLYVRWYWYRKRKVTT